MVDHFPELSDKELNIKTNSVIAKYVSQINNLPLTNHDEMSTYLTFESGSKYGKLLKLMLAVLTSPVKMSTNKMYC